MKSSRKCRQWRAYPPNCRQTRTPISSWRPRQATKALDLWLPKHRLIRNRSPSPKPTSFQKPLTRKLVKFESLPPDQQYLAKTTNPAINQLEGLDEKLNQTISGALKDRGVAGIDNFNRRYAAMASVRRALGRRVNAAELQREGTLAKAGKVVRAVTGRNVNSIASASQASLADVNIGDQLEKGLKDLKGSGVRPQIDAQPGAPKLSLKPPSGTVPGPRQEALPGTGMASSRSAAPETVGDAHQVPGPPDAKLTSPGRMPAAAQRPFSFMDTERPNQSGDVYPQGKGLEKTLSKPAPKRSGKAPGLVGNGYLEKTNGGTNQLSTEKTSPTSSSGSNGHAKTFAGMDFGADKQGLEQAKSELAAGKITRDKLLSRAQEIKDHIRNGSGESDASIEAQNAAKSDKAKGVSYYRVDTRSGNGTPMSGTAPRRLKAGAVRGDRQEACGRKHGRNQHRREGTPIQLQAGNDAGIG
jgi:hypothetical protein